MGGKCVLIVAVSIFGFLNFAAAYLERQSLLEEMEDVTTPAGTGNHIRHSNNKYSIDSRHQSSSSNLNDSSFLANYSISESGAIAPPPILALHEAESDIFRTLFTYKYVRDARPSREIDKPVAVSVEMVLMKINQIAERDQEIVITGYVKIAWQDERLSWNPKDFGNVEWIVVPSSSIWIPDIGLINAADMYSITRDFRFPAVVDYMGNVIWVPAGKLAARCEFDITYFPFDNQSCFYRMESWSYPINFLNITGRAMTVSPAHYVVDQQWHLKSSSVRNYVVGYEDGSFNFSRIDFKVELHRKPLYYVTYTIMPAVVLSTLQVFSHLLPVDDPNNRIAFATTGLITFSVLHVSISESMPKTSDQIPIIAIYVDVVMGLIASFLIETFFISHLLNKAVFSSPSSWTWTIVVEVLGRVVFYPTEKLNFKYVELNSMLKKRRRQYSTEAWRASLASQGSGDDGQAEHQPHPDHIRPLNAELTDFKHKQKAALRRMSVAWSMTPANAAITSANEHNNDKLSASHKRQQPLLTSRPTVTIRETLDSDNSNSHCGNSGSRRARASALLFHPHSSFYNNAGYDSSNYSSDDAARRHCNNGHTASCKQCSTLAVTLTKIRDDVGLLRELCEELGERQLRDLSLEVWNGLFAIVDRYLFLVAISFAILTPVYLFVILPPN